jgi:uncharacterized protein (DUF1778 family)
MNDNRVQINFRISKEEKRILEYLAALESLPVSQYLRRLFLKAQQNVTAAIPLKNTP